MRHEQINRNAEGRPKRDSLSRAYTSSPSTPAGHALRPRIVTSRSCCLYALGGQGRASFGGVAEPYVFGALRIAMLTLLTFGFGAAVALSLLALPWRVSTRIIFRWAPA